MIKTLLALSALAAVTFAQSYYQNPSAPTCTDGGQLHCCQATFSGGLAPVKMLADLACYDLTPAVVNCIICESVLFLTRDRLLTIFPADAPSDPNTGCVGEYACCQVNDLNPVLGLFCSKPPGGCTGDEGGNPPHCTDVINGRFGQCTNDDVQRNRGLLGLGTGMFKE
jgi:hypothetical protein